MARPQRLRAIALKLWLTAVVLTLAAAGTVYLAYKPNPARTNGAMATVLRVGGKVCVGLGLLTLACEACVLFSKPLAAVPGEGGARRYLSPFLSMGALAGAGATALWLDPQIRDAWDQIKGFGAAGAGDPALMRFKCLLGTNFALLSLQAFVVIVAVSLKPKAPAPADPGQPLAPETKPPDNSKP